MTAWAFSATYKICVYRYFLLFTHYDPHRAIKKFDNFRLKTRVGAWLAEAFFFRQVDK